jgi:hypothetical protein
MNSLRLLCCLLALLAGQPGAHPCQPGGRLEGLGRVSHARAQGELCQCLWAAVGGADARLVLLICTVCGSMCVRCVSVCICVCVFVWMRGCSVWQGNDASLKSSSSIRWSVLVVRPLSVSVSLSPPPSRSLSLSVSLSLTLSVSLRPVHPFR